MANITVLLDPGHGGIVNGKYVTPGKRSPVWMDGKQLFEGVFNRQIVDKIKNLLAQEGVPYLDVVDSEEDVPLGVRVKKANEFYKKDSNCIYISIHANAAGNGVIGHPARGFEVFTSVGQTKSDILATLVIDECEKLFTDFRLRKDDTDGDRDREENFYVLKQTAMPAILTECGFMTNWEECKLMMSDDFQWNIAAGHVKAIIRYIKSHG